MHSFVFGDRISERLAWTPEGYLVCVGVVLCRTGQMDYREDEITGNGSNERVTVKRAPQDVLSDRHVGSLEGKPVTEGHPPGFLSPQNVATFQKGHVQNVRVGKLPTGESCLIGDLVITDKALAEQIVSGKLREISTGYQCSYEVRGDGVYQVDFLANHVAVVQQGRANAGAKVPQVAIMDGGDMDHEERVRAAMNVVAEANKVLGIPERRRAEDADMSATAFSAAYADLVNQTGSRMRRETVCRPSLLRRAAQDSERETPTPQVSPEQQLEFFKRSEAYAAECRRLWRKSSSS